VISWIYVGVSLILTAYGQLVVKWRVMRRGHLPAGLHGKIHFFSGLLLDPWVLTAMFATFIAALCWMAAMSHLELSRAYPFAALSFATVLILSGVLLGEDITPAKIVGVAIVIVGLVVSVSL
jgi:drug/metabolite transporter (DMT)-like permease